VILSFGGKTMKITKKMLEQIIKEEIERSLQKNKEVKAKEKIEEE
tara:strand:+ start:244 stop:378 length:135 start_codon:yes stop_codon:yes gene_type:complete